MSDKPYDDAETLVKAYYTLNENGTASHKQLADHFGCSVGTISIRMNHYDSVQELIEKRSPTDYTRGKTQENLIEFTDEELEGYLESHFRSNFGEAEVDDGFVVVPTASVGVTPASINFKDAINACYERGYDNVGVAVSEANYSEELQKQFDKEAIGLIVIAESPDIASDCTLKNTSSNPKKSTLLPFFNMKDSPYINYQNPGWLRLMSEKYEIPQIAEQCHLLPRTVRGFQERFGITQ